MDTATAAALAVGLGAASVLVAALSIQGYLVERRHVYRSLRTVRTIDLPIDLLRHQQLARPFASRVLAPALRQLGRFARRLTPAQGLERIEQLLIYAGDPVAWDAERVLAVKFALGVAAGAAMFAFALALDVTSVQVVGFTVSLAALGFWAPSVLLANRARLRQARLRRDLPDSLDLLSITVQAGLAFDAAVERVARESEGPLAEEFHRTIGEMRLGEARVDALRAFAARTDVPEVKAFVLAMVQADIFGISVSKVLHVQAGELRTRRRQFAEERAQKVPVKLVFPLIGCIMPSLFVVLLGPGAMQLVNTFKGL